MGKNIDPCKNYSNAFVEGSKNYKRSAVFDHEKKLQHENSKDLEEKEKCETSGLSYRKSVYQLRQSLYKDVNLRLLNLHKM